MNRLIQFFYELGLKVRDVFMPPESILHEIDIKPGQIILDFGCGPGIYSLLVATRIIPDGKVYALDIEPAMIDRIKIKAAQKGIANIETILSGSSIDLPDQSVDIVFNFDMIHFIPDPSNILREIHRVLKTAGILAVTDHHLAMDKLELIFVKDKLFSVTNKGKKVLQLKKT